MRWENPQNDRVSIPDSVLVVSVRSRALHMLLTFHASSHAVELRDVGFTVVAAEISPMLLSAARIEACSALDSMLAQIDAVPDPKANSPRSAGAFSFREIVHRAPQRYDFRISQDGRFSKVCDEATTCAKRIVYALHDLPLHPHDHDVRTSWVRRALPRQPRAIMSGIVTSLPGASVQNFHADASPMHFALAAHVPRYRLFQVFFPLVDIPKDSIGTQFWAGSHLSRREREFWRWQGVSSLLEADASAKASMSSPACPVGSIIIFDYRIIHRGLGNHGLIARPIGHALLSTGLASDRQSYGRFPSVWDTAAIRRGGTPPSSDFAAPAGSRAFL